MSVSLLNVRTECVEAFVCDLGQRNAIKSIDLLDLVLSTLAI